MGTAGTTHARTHAPCSLRLLSSSADLPSSWEATSSKAVMYELPEASVAERERM